MQTSRDFQFFWASMQLKQKNRLLDHQNQPLKVEKMLSPYFILFHMDLSLSLITLEPSSSWSRGSDWVLGAARRSLNISMAEELRSFISAGCVTGGACASILGGLTSP